MFLINISPVVWDLIIAAILVFGLILGFVLGMRATLFLLCGNLITLGLAFAFKSLIIPKIVTFLSNLQVIKNQADFGPVIANNLAPTLYFGIWIIGFNILLAIIYLILKFTVLRNFKIKHRAINSCAGAIINLFRYSFLAGFVALFVGSGLIANKSTAIPNYYQNEISSKLVGYRVFSGIYPNYPLFEISNDDLHNAADLKNYATALSYCLDQFQQAQASKNIDDLTKALATFSQYFPFTTDEQTAIDNAIATIKANPLTYPDQVKIIVSNVKQRIGLDLANVNFMQSKFVMIADLINLYPSTTNFFVKVFQDSGSIDVQNDVVIKPLFEELKPDINLFLTKIPVSASVPMKAALQSFYQGWTG